MLPSAEWTSRTPHDTWAVGHHVFGMRHAIISDFCPPIKAVGLVALLYDHSLTLGDEVNLIWTARRSFLKWIFLTNHYMVGVCLIVVTNGAYIALPRNYFHDAQS